MDHDRTILQLEGVRKRYGDTDALAGIDLSLRQGEVVSFLGPNGAGKTTAIQIMLGLRDASAGRVRLFGADPRNASARARVGVMLQESGVPGSLRVAELIRLFQSTYPVTLPTDEILQRANLTEKRRALVSTLSGGQRQRLYFALALAGDPDLLFLDEPTVAMDVASRRTFWEQVREFAGYGKTVLFSTHYLDEADAIADRIVVIDRGRIIAQGTPAQIKALTADKTVRLRADLDPAELNRLPGVQRAHRENGHLVFFADEPESVLAELFRAGHVVTDLTVVDTELETAFVALTEGRDAQGAQA
jgi:ABC-2 type transport system ATP-binding protein